MRRCCIEWRRDIGSRCVDDCFRVRFVGGGNGVHNRPCFGLSYQSGHHHRRLAERRTVGNGSRCVYRSASDGRNTWLCIAVGMEGTGANGFEEPYLLAAFVAEAVFTFIFVLTVLGTTDRDNSSPHFAGLAIGLTLVLVHIVCIPVTGTSVNPARSIGPALFSGMEAISQLWLFIVAPIVGAVVAVPVWKTIKGN